MQTPKLEKGKRFEEMGSPILLMVVRYADVIKDNKKVKKSVKSDWRILAQKALEVLNDRQLTNNS